MTVSQENKDQVLNQFDFCKSVDEKNICARLLQAIRDDDFESANKVLRYGYNVRQAVMNLSHVEAIKQYGYDEFTPDKYGWQRAPEWKEIEVVELLGWGNAFSIGQGKNGMWAYGFDCSNSVSGQYHGINEWREPLSKKEAIKEALLHIKKFHLNVLNGNDKTEKELTIAKKVLKKIKEYQQPVQACLF